jgi:hypothetical protein
MDESTLLRHDETLSGAKARRSLSPQGAGFCQQNEYALLKKNSEV